MNISYSRTFKKDFKKLSTKIALQFRDRLELFQINPYDIQLNNHKVHHPYEGSRSINITGDIRALYDIDGDDILFIAIGSHSELYK